MRLHTHTCGYMSVEHTKYIINQSLEGMYHILTTAEAFGIQNERNS